jgi:TRAP-type mannitol/chloroaromatic compound transport system permease small subunit
MQTLLKLSRAIDALNTKVGHLTYWLVLVAVLISAGNAVIRYTFDISSNAWLELQWYLFSAIFLFCAGYTLLHNQHVRIDVITGRFSKQTQAWIDIFGTVVFLFPMAFLLLYLSWPIVIRTYTMNEVSTNAGGLPIWPARALVPIGFALLIAQGASELIKRVAFLKGLIADPSEKPPEKSAEEELAEAILRERGEKA